jgi:hypothetical protein
MIVLFDFHRQKIQQQNPKPSILNYETVKIIKFSKFKYWTVNSPGLLAALEAPGIMRQSKPLVPFPVCL